MGKRGEKLQSEVLSVVRGQSAPLSAYDVLRELQSTYPKIAPPTIYRALAALTERGQVHRLESMNAYVACQCDAHQQPSILSICDDCGVVEESVQPDVFGKLTSAVEKSGFSVQRHVVEVHGVCATCSAES